MLKSKLDPREQDFPSQTLRINIRCNFEFSAILVEHVFDCHGKYLGANCHLW